MRVSDPLHVIIPACGAGSRFVRAGFLGPKPLIRINGTPMVQHVINALPKNAVVHLLVPELLVSLYQDSGIKGAEVQGVAYAEHADGALATVLCADAVPLSSPVMVVNSDNVIKPADWLAFLPHVAAADGHIATFLDIDGPPIYSYIKERGHFVQDIAEKQRIGNFACAGAFWFRSYALLIAAAHRRMRKNPPDVYEEYYVAPVYRELLKEGAIVTHGALSHLDDKFVRIGTPEDLDRASVELQ